MKIEAIERYLDERGVTPGKWYSLGEKEPLGILSDQGIDKPSMFLVSFNKCPKKSKADANILAASREMLTALIERTLQGEKEYENIGGVDWDERFGDDYGHHIAIIESALPGRTWPEIKARLEEIEGEEK